MSRRPGRLRCVFRVAAGPCVGFGHLLRARALARAFGVAPVVSLRGGPAARATARALGCRLVAQSGGLLARANVLVVDDPSAPHGAAWIRRARLAGISCVAIQDAGVGARHADLIVDGSLAARRGSRAASALTGPMYCILDPGVARIRRQPRLERGSRRLVVLVSLGGGAQVRRHAVRLVGEIGRQCPGVSIQVASGMTGGSLPDLPRGRWIVRRGELAPALQRADIAVVAGGVTLYEACAIGTPVVATAVASAQRVAIAAFVRAGAALDGGHIGSSPASSTRDVAAAVAALVSDEGLRRRLAVNGRNLVDAAGAVRVARRIARLPGAAARRRRHV
jgi:spore coat polysaccharide biosynthesis predicted glycosyltransferase SpsG